MARKWTPERIVAAIRAWHEHDPALRQVRREDQGLYYAAMRYFGSWHSAVRAAGLTPFQRKWTRQGILDAIRARHEQGLPTPGHYGPRSRLVFCRRPRILAVGPRRCARRDYPGRPNRRGVPSMSWRPFAGAISKGSPSRACRNRPSADRRGVEAFWELGEGGRGGGHCGRMAADLEPPASDRAAADVRDAGPAAVEPRGSLDGAARRC